MVQELKETRRCVICGSTDKLMDLYYTKDIQAYSDKKATLSVPIVYCNQHFMSEVWTKRKEQQ